MSARAWTLGLGASALLHGAGLAAIGLTTEPQELPDQPVPKSQFSIEAAEVPRSRADAEATEGNTLPEAEADSTQAASGAVPQTVAKAASINGVVAKTASVIGTAVSAASNTGLKAEVANNPSAKVVASAIAPTAIYAQTQREGTVAAVTPTAVAVSSVSATPTVAQATQPATPMVNAVNAPVAVSPDVALNAAPIPESETSRPLQSAVTPDTQTAPATAPQSASLDQSPLPAIAGKATLAWAGDDSAAVSAESLAAIAAFTQEGDLSAASAQVRDGIEGILASMPCARLQTTFLAETGQLELRGHVPEEGLKGPVLAALRAQVGDAIPLSEELLILPRPQCGALAGIANIGLPQSNEQLDNPKVIGADGFARNTTYFDGDAFYLEMTGADYDAYLYVDYFDKDGNVIHLQPNEFVPNELVPADAEVLVAKSDGDKPALELTISAPFGQEIAAAFAASVPLYEGNRPLVEPAEPYLAFLKEQVAKARAEHPDFKGEWVYFFITTRAR